MGPNSSSYANPYFCKFLKTNEDHISMFQIPPEFMKTYGENMPENVTLRINESGKSWRVGIEKIGQNYFFTDGWKEFAKEVDVKLQEYLIFKFIGLSDASQSDSTLSNKDFSSDDDNGDGPLEKAECKNEDDESYACRKWRFVKELRERDAYRLNIPKIFAMGTGIARDRRLVVLVDAKGYKWPVRVTDRNSGQFSMTYGWYDFLKGNRVAVGSIVSFEFISTSENLIEVRVLENSARRGRGRPRLFAFVKQHENVGSLEKTRKNEDEEDNDTDHENGDARISNPEVSRDGRRQWRFVKKLKKHHAFMMDIPQDFATSTGIKTKEKIKLRVARGMNWPVDLRLNKRGVVSMTAGWNDFLVGNKVRIGSTISFEYVEGARDNIIHVRLLDKGGRENDLFQFMKRGRGRPPKAKQLGGVLHSVHGGREIESFLKRKIHNLQTPLRNFSSEDVLMDHLHI